ncbi:MAG TPA: HAD family phosphatase, partial [Devosia sp.]|nr:HAD family phosphatase [Devosia sp.]
LEKFDGVVVSGLEGFVKPDPRIFGTFCKRFGLRASDCVFIDDSELNVHGARAVGMQALHFTSSEKLRDDLIALGLPLQPAR